MRIIKSAHMPPECLSWSSLNSDGVVFYCAKIFNDIFLDVWPTDGGWQVKLSCESGYLAIDDNIYNDLAHAFVAGGDMAKEFFTKILEKINA